jgi:hypothetical protein
MMAVVAYYASVHRHIRSNRSYKMRSGEVLESLTHFLSNFSFYLQAIKPFAIGDFAVHKKRCNKKSLPLRANFLGTWNMICILDNISVDWSSP